jgi:hypothetical protein
VPLKRSRDASQAYSHGLEPDPWQDSFPAPSNDQPNPDEAHDWSFIAWSKNWRRRRGERGRRLEMDEGDTLKIKPM